MIFVQNSGGGRGVNMINTLSKINLSKIGWEGQGSTSSWIMSVNILFVCFDGTPKRSEQAPAGARISKGPEGSL